MIKRLTLSATVALLLHCTAAWAHTHLEKSTPADGSVIDTSPQTLELVFSEATRLTALTLEKAAEKKQSLGPLPKQPMEKVALKLPKLVPGEYVVNWRALGADNHLMSGVIRFTITPAASAQTPHSAHDH